MVYICTNANSDKLYITEECSFRLICTWLFGLLHHRDALAQRFLGTLFHVC